MTMGPPTKRRTVNKVEKARSVDDSINNNSNMRRRCLLCRSDACSESKTSRTRVQDLESCATSLCLIFGLRDNHSHSHPLKQLLLNENTDYCESCLAEIQEADLTLGQFQVLKQSLLRFQSGVYRKLGDNFFQIESFDSLKATYSDVEECSSKVVRKLNLSYDELVKIIFEKIDKESYHWESFSNATNQLVHSSTQTDAKDSDENWRRGTFGNDLSDGEGQGTLDTEYHDEEESICKQRSWQEPSPSGRNKSPRAKDSRSPSQNKNQNCQKSITETPINLEEKIYCTYGPKQCERFFYDKYNLMVHIKSFHEGIKKPHECPICKKSFIDEPRLKAHNQRRHNVELTVICDQCGQSFTSPAALRQHNRKLHGRKEKAKTSFNCSFCTAPLNSKADVEDHENLHRSNKSLYNCVFCSANFSDYNSSKSHFISEHRNHLVSHTSQNASKSSVNCHKKVHAEEKFQCEICGSRYKFAKNLASHMRIHTGKNLYTCRICNAAFVTKSNLMQHEQSHSDIANYENGEYDNSFTIKQSLANQGLLQGSNKAPESTDPQVPKTKKRKTMKLIEGITNELDDEEKPKTKQSSNSNSVLESDYNLQKKSDIGTTNTDGGVKNQDKTEMIGLTVVNKSNDEIETTEGTVIEGMKLNTVMSEQSLELYQDEMVVEIAPEGVAETVNVITDTTVEVCPETQTFIIDTEN